MLRLSIFALLLVSCATSASGTCQTPVHDACVQKSQDNYVFTELVKIAARQGMSMDDMTTEYVNACESQVDRDLEQTLVDLETLADAGVKDGSP